MKSTEKNKNTNRLANTSRSFGLREGAKDSTTSEATPMIYIYARVSTEDQTTANQVQELAKKYPGATLVLETASGVKQRPKLEALIEGLEPNELVYTYSLDRLGRSTKDIIETIERIMAKGARLELKREGMSYDSAMGKLVIQVMAAVAELERNLISERTKTALQARKAKGVKLGPPKKHPDRKRQQALKLLAEGKPLRIVAKYVGVSKSQVHKWALAGNE